MFERKKKPRRPVEIPWGGSVWPRGKGWPTDPASGGPLPPYGVAIREAVARGDLHEMRSLVVEVRKWIGQVRGVPKGFTSEQIADIRAAVRHLEKTIRELDG